MNNFRLVGADFIDESAQFTWDEATSTARRLLNAIASDQDFATKVTLAFGESFDAEKLEALRQQWEAGDFESLPPIEISLSAEINGANGAFSADTNKIYLSQEYLIDNASNTQAISDVLLEEIGHFVDAKINILDAPGDEGEIFSAVVRGVALNKESIQRLKTEDDRASISLNEENIEIEQARILDIGGFEGTRRTITLGSQGGETVKYSFDNREFIDTADDFTFTTDIPDNFILRYEGRNILETGFIGGSKSGEVFIPQGNSNQLEVIVETNNPDTLWRYDVTTSFFPDTTPLNIEVANAEFADADNDGHADAQGTIYIGRKDGILRLLRIENAKAELEDKDKNGEDETLKITGGTVFSEIGNVSQPLFLGDFEIPFKTAKTSSLTDNVGPKDELKFGGLDVDYKSFRLDPDKIILEGGFVFPIISGGLEVDLNAPNAVVIDNDGVTTGGFTLPIVEGTKLLNLIEIKGVSDLKVEYKKIDDLFKIQGKISAQPFFKVLEDIKSDFVLDLAGDNYIQIQNGIADVKGAISIKNVGLPGGFKLSELSVNLKTEKGELKEIGGKGQFKFPFPILSINGGGLDLGFRLNPFELNKIGLNVTDLDIPIGNTSAYLQKLGLTFDKIAPSDPGLEVTGLVGLTVGPRLTSLIRLDTNVKVSNEKFVGEIKELTVIEDKLYKATGSVEYNWNKKVAKAEVDFKAGFETFKGKQKLTLDFDKKAFSGSGSVNAVIPKGLPLIGGKEVGGLNFQAIYKDDDTFANDSLAAWKTFKIPFIASITVGLKFSFDGKFKIISRARDIPKTNSFDVQPGTQFLLLAADWDNETDRNIQVRVKDPNGNFIEEADFAAHNIAIADELTGSNTKTLIINNPAPGNWDLILTDDAGLGEVRISGLRDSVVPTIQVMNPIMNPASSEVTIDYEAFDADSDAEIKLFYDTDDADFDGVLISDSLIEKDGAGRFVWNTEGVPTGDYFIYAMITDENNPPEFSYSQSKVKIAEEADLSVTQTANTDLVGVGENLTYTVKVTNNGSINSKGVTLVQALPEEVTFVSASLKPSKQENNTLTFDLSDLAGGESTTVDITVAAPTTVGTITSNSFVTSRTFDPDQSNNVDPFTAQVDVIPPKLPDLAVTRTASPNSVNLGNTFTYTLTVTNNGSGDTTGVVLTENLFSGFTFVNATTSQGRSFFDSDKNVVTVNLDNLNHGEQATVNMTVKPIAAGNLVSTTRVTGNEAEFNLFNNSIIEQITVNPIVPLNIIVGTPGNDFLKGTPSNDFINGLAGNDTIEGDAGDDILIGGSGAGWPSDILNGGSGNDTASYINATSGVAASLEQKLGWLGDATGDQFISIENLEGSNYDDFLIGDNGANILSGLAGNDTLEGRDGDDTLNGGEGNNILNAGEGNNTVQAGSGNDTVYAGAGNDTISTNGGNDQIYAGDGNNTIDAGDGTNKIYAGTGYDYISAGTGDDEIYVGNGGSTIFAGAGNNKVYAGTGYDSVYAEDGDDLISVGDGGSTIRAGNGKNTVYAGTGDDEVYTGTGDDEIHVGEGNNYINAGSGKNTISAGSGNDVIDTGAGDDTIYANEGLNTIRAGDGNNKIYSGSGSDFIFAGSGDDLIHAGEGQNYIDAAAGNNTISSGASSDFILSGNGNDLIYAGEGNNRISAGNGNNTIYAGAGNDEISTGSGNDLIYAGEGNNLIATGTGFDTVYAGSGVDRFSLSEGLGAVTIIGFQANQDLFLGVGSVSFSISGNDTFVSLSSSDDLLAIVKDVHLV